MAISSEFILQEMGLISPHQAREFFRENRWAQETRGISIGYAQYGLVVLPQKEAHNFLLFTQQNLKVFPLQSVLEAGEFRPDQLAKNADIRTDLPRYQVYRNGLLIDEPSQVLQYWHDELVTFLFGCSLTFDQALTKNDIPNRQLERGGKPSIYKSSIRCRSVANYQANTYVSMRPMTPVQAIRAIQVTSRFPNAHGAPIHFGSPNQIGIKDLSNPEIGEKVQIFEGEVPVFWACVATIWDAIRLARPAFAITHFPGSMFIGDKKDEELALL